MKSKLHKYKEELLTKINKEILDISYVIYMDDHTKLEHARLVDFSDQDIKDLFALLSSMANRKIEILEIKRSKTYISEIPL